MEKFVQTSVQMWKRVHKYIVLVNTQCLLLVALVQEASVSFNVSPSIKE